MGSRVSPASIDQLNSRILENSSNKERLIIASQNLHSIYLWRKNKYLKEIHQQALMRIDGMGILILAKLIGIKVNSGQRVTWMDWKDDFFQYCQDHSLKIYYLGSKPQVCESAIINLKNKFPYLNITGQHGYFDKSSDSNENIETLKEVNNAKAHILLVGFGMPLQETWIINNKEKINAPVILTCGAAMEYIAGYVNTPPRWIGRVGLEWLYRLLESPSRFWERYLIEPWVVFFMFLSYKLKSK